MKPDDYGSEQMIAGYQSELTEKYQMYWMQPKNFLQIRFVVLQKIQMVIFMLERPMR